MHRARRPTRHLSAIAALPVGTAALVALAHADREAAARQVIEAERRRRGGLRGGT